MRRFIPAIATTAVVAMAWALPVQAATTIKVSTCHNKTHDHAEVFFKAFFNPLNKNKQGLELKYIGGPEITPFRKQGALVKRGLIDMIFCPTPYYGGLLTEARMPGVHNKSLAEMRKNGAWDMLQKAWNKGLNAQIIAWPAFDASTFHIYTKFKPKISEKTGLDLTGRKMRSTGLYNPLLKAMNALPINISPSDVFTGLQRGVVDGIAWPKGSIGKYGWQKFLKYRISPNFYGGTFFVIMNKKKYDGLSAAHKKLIAKHARAYEKKSDELVREKFVVDEAKLKAAGVQDIKLTGKAATAFLNTVYGAKWAQNDSLKYIVDYKKLKSLMYTPK